VTHAHDMPLNAAGLVRALEPRNDADRKWLFTMSETQLMHLWEDKNAATCPLCKAVSDERAEQRRMERTLREAAQHERRVDPHEKED